MQLILALAAHFKPASIKGRKHTYTDKMHRTPTSNSKQKYGAKFHCFFFAFLYYVFIVCLFSNSVMLLD